MALFRKRKSAPEIETRAFADWQGKAFPSPFTGTYAGSVVTDGSTLSLPAAWRSVNLIADAVASSPLQAFRNGEKVAPPPIVALSYDQKFAMTASLLLRGNAYGYLNFDSLAYPTSVELLHPDEVSVTRQEGRALYRVNGTEVPSELLLHVRGFCLPGALTGVGVVEACRESLSGALSTQEHAHRYFSEAAVPPLILETEHAVTDDEGREQLRQIRDSWVENHGRSRKPSVLTGGLTAKTLAFSSKDAQFLESRQFSLNEIALMFGVPPYLLGAPVGGMTYSNVEQESLNFAKFSLRPWLTRIEQAFDRLTPRGTYTRFNLDSILRADTTTRYAAHSVALASGFMTVDEVRALEDLPPLSVPEVTDDAA